MYQKTKKATAQKKMYPASSAAVICCDGPIGNSIVSRIAVKVIILLFISSSVSAQIWKDTTIAGLPTSSFTPHAEAKFPAMVYLHGVGERGDNLNLLCIKSHPSPLYYAKDTLDNVPVDYFVLAPQLPKTYGSWPTAKVYEIIKYVRSLPQVDSTQIWLVGHSLGGGGVYNIVTNATYQKSISAFVVIAPVSISTSKAQVICNAGINGRAYHAELDPITSYSSTANITQAVNALCFGRLELFTYKGSTSHAIVPKVFKDKTFVPWLKQQRR
jgi:predicted peptidase